MQNDHSSGDFCCKFTVIFNITIMKTNLIYIFCAVVCSILLLQGLNAQPLTWDKSYQFPEMSYSHFTKIIPLADGDLLLAGYGNYAWAYFNPGFIRLDSNGVVKSSVQHHLNGSFQQITHTLVQVNDSVFYSFSFNPNIEVPIKNNISGIEPINHCWLLKLNADGDTLSTYYTDSIGYVNDMICHNGLLIAVGSTNYEVEPWEFESKTTLLITDTLGNQMLRQEYLPDLNSRAHSILRLENGNYMICGSTAFNFHTFDIYHPDQMFLLETDSAGNVLWTYFSDIPYSQANKITQCSEGSFAIIGDGYNAAVLNRDIILWRMNADKEIVEPQFFDFSVSDRARSIKQTPDGGFIVCGDIRASGPPSRSVFFYMKVDADGLLEWFTHNHGNYHHANDVILNHEHGYFIAGYGVYAKLVKSDLLGNGLILSAENHKNPSSLPDFKVYPNPGSHYLIVSGIKDSSASYIKLFNNLGEPVISKELNDYCTAIDTEQLPAGLYFYRIFSGNNPPESGVWIKR